MKNKTKTYLLLAAVLAIWGIIGFKIMSTLNPEAPEVKKQDEMVVFTPKSHTVKDTFSIRPAQRDPFLGTLYAKKQENPAPRTPKPKEAFVWISITYHGTVSKQDSKEKLCILSINGQQHIMKIGQEVQEVKLVKASNTEILVNYKGQRKTVPKQ